MPEWTDLALQMSLRALTLVGFFLLFRALKRWPYLYALVWWPSTLVHEISHFLVGLLLAAHPTRLSALPRRDAQTHRWILGEVGFANLRWWNKLPVAIAPLLLMLPLGLWLISTTLGMPYLSGPTLLLEWAALQCLVGCWPSATDWAHALSALLVLSGLAVLALLSLYGLLKFTPIGDHFEVLARLRPALGL